MASLLRNALRRLDPLPAEFGGISVDALRSSLQTWIKGIDHPETLAQIPFPSIV
jgi:hypothetical protein